MRISVTTVMVILVLLAVSITAADAAMSSANYRIETTVLSGGGTWVKFCSAADKAKGIEIVGNGELKMLNGGQMKIYE